jgi:hypothetical protein
MLMKHPAIFGMRGLQIELGGLVAMVAGDSAARACRRIPAAATVASDTLRNLRRDRYGMVVRLLGRSNSVTDRVGNNRHYNGEEGQKGGFSGRATIPLNTWDVEPTLERFVDSEQHARRRRR